LVKEGDIMSSGIKAIDLINQLEKYSMKTILIEENGELKEIKSVEFKEYDMHAKILKINV